MLSNFVWSKWIKIWDKTKLNTEYSIAMNEFDKYLQNVPHGMPETFVRLLNEESVAPCQDDFGTLKLLHISRHIM